MGKAKKSKKLSQKTLLFFKVFSFISFFLFFVFGVLLCQLDVLPFPILAFILGTLLVIAMSSIASIFFFRKPFQIFGFILMSFLFILSITGSYFVYHTDEFLNRSFTNGVLKQSTSYYVLAKSGSNIQNLNDITGSISYLENAYLIEQVEEMLHKEKDISLVPYHDVNSMFEDLKNGNITSLLTEQTSYELLLDLKKDFTKDDFQIVHEFIVTTEIENNSSNLEDGKYMIYIGGNDFTNSLMDFNMIVTINTHNHQVMLTSIPRDYYIPVSGYGGRKDTLSFMGARGIEVNRKSLEEFLELDLNYYIKIQTSSLVRVVDEVGGIDYCSDTAYTTTHATILDTYDDSKGQKLQVKKGCQHLNGIEALTVARERLAFPGGDRQRQKNCQQIIMAIFKQLISANTITNYNNILNSLGDLYQTNIPREVISEFIKETINGAQWQIESQSLDGTDGQGYVHLSNLTSYVMNPLESSVLEAKDNIKKILN